MKTNNLTGSALDWAVAKCLGLETYIDDGVVCLKGQPFDGNGHYWLPTQSWGQGGPIIERNIIAVYPDPADGWRARPFGDATYFSAYTPLVAAMRCYVASVMGDDVDVPAEMIEGA